MHRSDEPSRAEHNASYLSESTVGGRRRDLSGEMTLLGRSEVDEERVFTGVSSFLWKRRILTQEAHLNVEAPEFLSYWYSVSLIWTQLWWYREAQTSADNSFLLTIKCFWTQWTCIVASGRVGCRSQWTPGNIQLAHRWRSTGGSGVQWTQK
jgi:hypothetical protein